MHAKQPTMRRLLITRSSVLLIVCCILLLLSGCADPTFLDTHAQAQPDIADGQHVPAKSDANGTPTEAVRRTRLAKAQQMMQGMSLEQKLGQLIIVEYIGASYQDSGLQYMINQQFVGGFMYQESNNNFTAPYNTINNVSNFSQQANADAKIPLLIATDQEGGLVNRLSAFHGDLPSASAMAASGDPNTALTQGTQDAKWMLELGINADLAPVVDVSTVSNPLLQSRIFGSDPKTVTSYAGAFLNGLQNNGVAGCLKHFPGLGSLRITDVDPHHQLPVVNRSKQDLETIDFAPYKAMIATQQPAMIMSTDVLMPAIDPNLPAELSPATINGVLRGELGYDGVVITDGLYMGGITAQWTLSQAAVLSIVAGEDLIEGPYTPNQVAGVVEALKQAIQQGQLSVDRIDQSVSRILLMKMEYGLIK